MTKDEFDRIERYTQELEALRHYPQVKKERDSRAVEAPQLRRRVKQLEGQLKSEVSTGKELSARLRKREAEAEDLAAKLDQAQREISALRDFKVRFTEGSELRLEEIRAQFLEAQKEQIERGAQERLGKLEKDIRSRMPALVQKELMRVLKRPRRPAEIQKVIDSHTRRMAEETLRDSGKWPGWFKDYYLHQVKGAVAKGLDSEFESRVQAEAQKRLDAMKADHWGKYIASKAKELAMDLKGLVGQLQGTWWFTCDRCGRRLAVDIGPSEIGELLGGRTVDVACSSCTDPAPFPLILSTVPHKVGTLSLEGLVRLYVGGPPTTE